MTVAMGIDVGRVHDKTVLVVIEEKDGLYWVRAVIDLGGLPFAEQQARIKKACERYHVDVVAVDSSGIGRETAERLKDELPVLVLQVSFTEENKSILIGVSYEAFTSGKMRVPSKYRRLLEEFANIRKETTATGRIVFRDSPHHGDVAWAAALALYALRHVGQVVLLDGRALLGPDHDLPIIRTRGPLPDWVFRGRVRGWRW